MFFFPFWSQKLLQNLPKNCSFHYIHIFSISGLFHIGRKKRKLHCLKCWNMSYKNQKSIFTISNYFLTKKKQFLMKKFVSDLFFIHCRTLISKFSYFSSNLVFIDVKNFIFAKMQRLRIMYSKKFCWILRKKKKHILAEIFNQSLYSHFTITH